MQVQCPRCERKFDAKVAAEVREVAVERVVEVPVAVPVPLRADGTLPTLAEAERGLIFAALRMCRGNKVAAEKMLGISRTTMYRKLHEYEERTADERT